MSIVASLNYTFNVCYNQSYVEKERIMEGTTSTLLVVFVFTFIPLILAEVARKRSLPTIRDFFIQNREMPLVLVFFTVYATWVSSFAFM